MFLFITSLYEKILHIVCEKLYGFVCAVIATVLLCGSRAERQAAFEKNLPNDGWLEMFNTPAIPCIDF